MLRRIMGQWAVLILVICCFATAGYAQNPIQVENLKAGTTDWQLTNPALNHEIEGYANLTSVNRGGQISFYVKSNDANYTIDIFRAGWYGLAGGRRVMNTITRARTTQPSCPTNGTTGMTECQWTSPYVLTVPGSATDPTNWASGVYLAKLTGTSSGKQSYIIFVVRDDARPSAYLFALDVTTYQAYNNWGGKSLYDFNSTSGVRASKVSYNRPYAASPQNGAGYGVGAGEFITNFAPDDETWPAAWEYNSVRWLEKEGYDVGYATVVDLHEKPNLLLIHAAYLSFGHNEYWSMAMYNNVEAARDDGISLAFFGANVSYWQIRFETSPVTGQANRTQVCYKSTADPVDGPTETVKFRDVGASEAELIGISYITDPVHGDIVVQNTSHWVFQGTGLIDGDRLTGLMGYEVDGTDEDTPPGTILLASSPIGGGENSHMSVYTAASGATVFATGSMQWAWGLDEYNSTALRPSYLSSAAQQITKNLLAKFIENFNPIPPFTPIRVNAGGAAYTDTLGQSWSADTGFTGGSAASTTAAITNTTDQTLYKSERWGTFSYNFTVPAGAYSVTLKFAEIFFTASGKRAFNVAINGTTVLTNFDVFAQAGGANRAVDRTFTVNSTGTIAIQFLTGSTDLPKVSAIEIISLSAIGVQVSPAGASLSGGQAQQFTATVTGSSNTAVTWSRTPSVGTLSSGGLYTAPGTITTQQVVTVTATSVANTTKSASAAVTLNRPDFAISASPSSRTIVQGSGTTYTATITPSGGFSAAVAMSVSGLPVGAGGTFSPTSVPGGTGTSTLSVTTATTTPAGAYTLTLTGTSGTLVHTATATLIVNPLPGGFFPIRVNAGGSAYSDSLGLIWSADTGFTGGSAASTTAAITNTTDQTLYKSERWGASSYAFAAPVGTYSVTLKFAEIYYTAAGQRAFNVAINGTTVLTNFDVFAQAGGANRAVDRTFTVNSTGAITIQFLAGTADQPKVSAIEIVGVGGVVVQVNPASASLGGGQTQKFAATVSGTSNATVTWSWTPSVGTLSGAGLYTAPATVTTQQAVTVTATSVVDTTRSASAAVTLLPPDFAVSASPSSQTAVQGSGTSYTATVTPTNGFSAAVAMSVSGLPAGAGGTFSPTSVPGGSGTSTLSVTTAAGTPTGTYTLTLTGTSGTLVRTTTATLIVSPPVVVQVTPTSASLNGGQTRQFAATVTGSANTAVTWSMTPSVGTLSSAGLYTAPATVTTQQAVTVTATSVADTTKSASATVTLNPADFSIAASPSSRTVVQGSGTTYTATITPTNGFGAAVALSVSGLPAGAGSTFSPTSVSGGTGTSTLSVSTAVSTPAGTYTLTLTGTSGTLVHTATVTLIVNSLPAGGFTPIRVHSGGGAYTDTLGQNWSADTGFTGGSTASTTAAITNTTDQTLYQSERYGPFSYNFAAPAGAYSVTLKFAEIYYTSSGQRIFNVAINGTNVLTNFDVFAQAGGTNRAVDRNFTVSSAGTITIQFITGSADLPKISAIEIVAASGVVVQVNPASASLGGSQTQQFAATVTGSANTAVTWSRTPAVGTLSSAGLYTAPATITTQQVVTVTATSVADTTRSASAAVTLLPPDFTVSASPSSRTVVQGVGTSYTATVTPTNGFGAAVALSVSGLPTGAGGTFSPTSVGGSGSSTLSVTTAVSTPAGAYTLTITGTSGALVRTTTVALIVNPVAGGFSPIRVNTGGAAYTDTLGLIWSADTGFTGGNTASTTAVIANTTDQTLYQSERYGASTYTFAAPAGAYSVTLKFAEFFYTASGRRIFDVAINGTTVLTNFDIFVQAGGVNKAVDRTFAVNSTGTITIQFVTGSADLPKVSAIQIQ